MAEYTSQLDSQISDLLSLRGRATLDDLCGISPAEAADFLAEYARRHADERRFAFNGTTLSLPLPNDPNAPGPEQPMPSPVAYYPKQEIAAPVLRAPEKVEWYWWVLPVVFAWVGGIIAWLAIRPRDPGKARALLGVGLAVTLLLTGSSFAWAYSILHNSAPHNVLNSSEAWPASASGRPTLYYFGTSTSQSCKEMKPVVDQLQQTYNRRVDFALYPTIDLDSAGSKLANTQGVTVVPTMMVVAKDGRELRRFVGAQPQDTLAAALDDALSRP